MPGAAKWTPSQELALFWAGIGASAEGTASVEVLGKRAQDNFAGERVYLYQGQKMTYTEVMRNAHAVTSPRKHGVFPADASPANPPQYKGGQLEAALAKLEVDWSSECPGISMMDVIQTRIDVAPKNFWLRFQELVRELRAMTGYYAQWQVLGSGKVAHATPRQKQHAAYGTRCKTLAPRKSSHCM